MFQHCWRISGSWWLQSLQIILQVRFFNPKLFLNFMSSVTLTKEQESWLWTVCRFYKMKNNLFYISTLRRQWGGQGKIPLMWRLSVLSTNTTMTPDILTSKSVYYKLYYHSLHLYLLSSTSRNSVLSCKMYQRKVVIVVNIFLQVFTFLQIFL